MVILDMFLFHHTGWSQAVSIIKNGRFIPVDMSPLNADSGLNCYDSRTGYWRNIHEDDGVILVLEWVGEPAKIVGRNFPPPYQTGMLLDMHPWRMFVPAPLCGQNLLRISHLKFLSSDLRGPFFGRDGKARLPRFMKKLSRKRRGRLELLKELRAVYRANDCWISIY